MGLNNRIVGWNVCPFTIVYRSDIRTVYRGIYRGEIFWWKELIDVVTFRMGEFFGFFRRNGDKTAFKRRDGVRSVCARLVELFASKNEVSSEIFFAHDGVLSEFFRRPLEENFSFKKEVGSVGDREGFGGIMVGNEYADVFFF